MSIEAEREAHSLHSNARENVLEHLFIGELLRTLWCLGVRDAEVLRSEVDASGYDLVIECNGIIRHIQLKSSYHLGKVSRQNINVRIAGKPSGCVVWIIFDQNTLALGPYRWFGGAPGYPIPSLGDVVARHTKGDSTGYKAERKNVRVVNKSRFREVATMSDLLTELFGSLSRKPDGIASMASSSTDEADVHT